MSKNKKIVAASMALLFGLIFCQQNPALGLVFAAAGCALAIWGG